MFVYKDKNGNILFDIITNSRQSPEQIELTTEQKQNIELERQFGIEKKKILDQAVAVYDKYQTVILSNSVKIVLPLSMTRDGILVKDKLVNLINESRSTYWVGFRDLYGIDGKQYQIERASSVVMDHLGYIVLQIFGNNKVVFQKYYSKILNSTTNDEANSLLQAVINLPKIQYSELDFSGSRKAILHQFTANVNKIILNSDIDLDFLCDDVANKTDDELLEDYPSGEIEAFRAWYSEVQQYKINGKYKLFIPL